MFVGVITFAFSVVGLVGVGKQEAFQLLWNASAIVYALTYLVMLAIPIAGLRDRTPAAPLWIRACALSGFLMTLLFVVLAIVPIVQVESRRMFAVKLSGLVLITNAIGLAIFSSMSEVGVDSHAS